MVSIVSGRRSLPSKPFDAHPACYCCLVVSRSWISCSALFFRKSRGSDLMRSWPSVLGRLIRFAAQVTAEAAQSVTVAALASGLPRQTILRSTGTVVDALTGEPIRKALVKFERPAAALGVQRWRWPVSIRRRPRRLGFAVRCKSPATSASRNYLAARVPPVEVGAQCSTRRGEAHAGIRHCRQSHRRRREFHSEHVSLTLTYIDIRDGRRRWESKGSATRRRRPIPLRQFAARKLLTLGAAPYHARWPKACSTPAAAEVWLCRHVLPRRA